jgi:hypothetical protein
MEFDKNIGNKLWQELIKTELKQHTDYPIFTILVGYQKIPYHMIFDIKYDQSHKTRFVSDSNWTVDDK